MKRVMLLLLAIVISLTCLSFPTSAAVQSSFNLTASFRNANNEVITAVMPGDRVYLTFSISDISGLGVTGGSFDVHYDPTALEPERLALSEMQIANNVVYGDVDISMVSSPGSGWVASDWTNTLSSEWELGSLTLGMSNEAPDEFGDSFSQPAIASTPTANLPSCRVPFTVKNNASLVTEIVPVIIDNVVFAESETLSDIPDVSVTNGSVAILKTIEPITVSGQVRKYHRRTEDIKNKSNVFVLSFTYINVPVDVMFADLMNNMYGGKEGYLKVFDKNGAEIAVNSYRSKKVGTDCTIKLVNSAGNVFEEIKICVYGDLNSDGRANATDRLILRRYSVDKYVIPYGAIYLAGDMNGDKRLNSTDSVLYRRYQVGKCDLTRNYEEVIG